MAKSSAQRLTFLKALALWAPLFLVFIQSARADYDHGKYAFVTPFLLHENGTFKFEDGGDSGTFSGTGVGGRIGYQYYFVFAALEGNVLFHQFSHHRSLTGPEREAYYLPDRHMTNIGGTIGANLGRVTAHFSMYIDSKVEGKITNNASRHLDGEFTYHGVGARIGLDIRLFSGLSLGIASSSYGFSKYSVDRDVNSLTKVDKADHPKLAIEATTVILSYRFMVSEEGKKK